MTFHKFLHKISRDILISLIIIYFFLLIPELVLPGIVSMHASPKYFLALLIVAALAHAWLGRKYPTPSENARFGAISKNLTNILLAVSAAGIILSLYKMKIWQIIVVTIFSLALFLIAEKMLVQEE